MKFLLFGFVMGQEGSGELQVAPMAVTEPIAVPFAVEDVSSYNEIILVLNTKIDLPRKFS